MRTILRLLIASTAVLAFLAPWTFGQCEVEFLDGRLFRPALISTFPL